MPTKPKGGHSEAVEYEPISVKELLTETKDTSELLIDLAYSAVLHNSEDLAAEVLELEEAMDVLQMQARMSLLLAARNPSEAEQLAPVLGIIAGAEKISDAAGDIAKIAREEMGLPDTLRLALPEAVEPVARATVDASSSMAGQTLVDIDLETQTGVRVIALRRESEWLVNPGPDTRLEPDDVVTIRGPEQSLGSVYHDLTGTEYSVPTVDDVEPDEHLQRAVDMIVLMKDLSELAVDLAYSSVLFDNAELAEEVHNLEVEVDGLRSRFEAWTLEAAANMENPVALRGLIHLGFATETISDAAIEITEGVLRDIDVHPVTQIAVQESEEVIARVTVTDGSELDGAVVKDGIPAIHPPISILMVRRPEEGWVHMADEAITLQPDDVIIAKGTNNAIEEFTSLAAA